MAEFPVEMDSYHELFLGGGSVLFALLTFVETGKIKVNKTINVYDYNESLIMMYKNIQTKPLEVYKYLEVMIKDYYESIDAESNKTKVNRKPVDKKEGMTSGETYYYWIRINYNKLTQQEKNSCNGSAIFIFLNKTCFRGMFREGPNGYNVPYGNYSKPEIVNKKHLLRISKLIKNVNFTHMDFSESIKNVKTKDFVYLDPPYAPETKTSFVGYTKKGFDIELHDNLFKKCNELKDKKIKFLLSNANVELVQNAFPKEKFTIKIIVCKRSINSKKPGSKTEEVLIKSF